MKTKPAILTLLLACATLPLRGNEAPVPLNPVAVPPVGTAPTAAAPVPVAQTGGGINGNILLPAPAPSFAGAGGGMVIAGSPAGTAPIEIKVRQIELDVALKQYEKIATAFAEAQSEAELFDSREISDAQLKEKRIRVEEKLMRLSQIKDRLRAEIMRTDAELADLRKKYGVPTDVPVMGAGGGIPGFAPGGARR